MTALPHAPLSQAEFPTWEASQEAKYEFVGGHVYSLAGGTVRHNAIAAEVLAVAITALRGGPCRAFGSDMLVEMARSTRYGDVVVTSDERDADPDAGVIRFPELIVEVLSESTAETDLGAKMREYREIETLEEYALIDSRRRWPQVMRRKNAEWVLTVPVSSGVLELQSIHAAIDLDGIYEATRTPRER